MSPNKMLTNEQANKLMKRMKDDREESDEDDLLPCKKLKSNSEEQSEFYLSEEDILFSLCVPSSQIKDLMQVDCDHLRTNLIRIRSVLDQQLSTLHQHMVRNGYYGWYYNWFNVPLEIRDLILGYLEFPDQIRTRLVCKSFLEAFQNLRSLTLNKGRVAPLVLSWMNNNEDVLSWMNCVEELHINNWIEDGIGPPIEQFVLRKLKKLHLYGCSLQVLETFSNLKPYTLEDLSLANCDVCAVFNDNIANEYHDLKRLTLNLGQYPFGQEFLNKLSKKSSLKYLEVQCLGHLCVYASCNIQELVLSTSLLKPRNIHFPCLNLEKLTFTCRVFGIECERLFVPFPNLKYLSLRLVVEDEEEFKQFLTHLPIKLETLVVSLKKVLPNASQLAKENIPNLKHFEIMIL